MRITTSEFVVAAPASHSHDGSFNRNLRGPASRRALDTGHMAASTLVPAPIVAVVFGTHTERNKEAQVKTWETISIITALLLSVTAAGFYTSIKLNLSYPTESVRLVLGLRIGHATTFCFCVTCFCFLTSSATSIFFRNFSGSTTHDLRDIKYALGMCFPFPFIFLRLGFIGLVLSLSLMLEMSGHLHVAHVGDAAGDYPTLTCLATCIVFTIAPTVLAMARSMQTFADDLPYEAATAPKSEKSGARSAAQDDGTSGSQTHGELM